MACKRAATCRARFARGEQACVRCAEGKLDIGDVEDLDDEEDNLDEGEVDDVDDVDNDDDIDDDDEEVGYTTQPNKMFGEIAETIVINERLVPGIRVTVTEDGEDKEYVIAVEDGPNAIPDDIRDDIDSEVDRFAASWELLYDVLEELTGRVIKQK